MLFHQIVSKTKDGHFEIDMEAVRQLSDAFDDGKVSDECLLAKLILTAFHEGIEQGIEQSEERHRQTALLLMSTAGSA
jgi:hypothetical protein